MIARRTENFDNLLDFNIQILKKLVITSLMFLVLMSLFRFYFFFLYGGFEQIVGFEKKVIEAFWLGVRYDFVVLSYIHILFVFVSLLFLILFQFKRYVEKIKTYFLWHYFILFLLVSFIQIVDIGFYGYFHDHLNILIFGFFDDDTRALVTTIWKNYPVFWILFLIFCFSLILYFFLKKTSYSLSHQEQLHVLPVKGIIIFNKMSLIILFLVFIFLGARGSLSSFPLGLMDAVISSNEFVNQVSLNGSITLQRAIKQKIRQIQNKVSNIEYFGYKGRENEAILDFLGIKKENVKLRSIIKNLEKKTVVNDRLKERPPHVLVIVMEGFGSYWLKYHSEKFNLMGELESHFNEDFYFPHFISATSGSTLGSVTSIVTNLPHHPFGPYLSESEFLNIPIRTSAAIPYKKNKYHTRYIYGGSTGWRNMNRFFPVQGFDSVEGIAEIQDKFSLDSKTQTDAWGVFDEHLFDYIFDVLQNSNKPQFILGLSTTNHPPYTLPKSYSSLPLEFPSELSKRLVGNKTLAYERMATYQYANCVLGKFLTRLKQSDLAGNTIVAITGDHSFNIINFNQEESFQRFRVPFYIYLPEDLRPKNYDNQVFGSHKDIMTTLYHFSLSDTVFYSMGENLFDSLDQHYSLNQSRYIFSKEGAVFFQDRKQLIYFDWNDYSGGLLKASEFPNEHHKFLQLKYRSGVSTLDLLLEGEKKHSKRFK